MIAAQLDSQEPGRSTTLTIRRASVPGNLGGPIQSVGAVAIAAFSLILLIACANVANLLLARATARGREIAMRLSLGATRARIVRQLMTESTLIFLAGGAVGSVLAVWSFQALTAMVLSSFVAFGAPPVSIDTSPDLSVLAFAAVLSLGTGLVFGLAPALHVSQPDLHGAAKPDALMLRARAGGGLRGLLVGIQVALCMVLLVGAALLLRGLQAAQTAEPGFEYRGIAVVSADATGGGLDGAETARFQRQLIDRVRELPGVDAVASAALTPMYPANMGGGFRTVDGETEPFSFNLVSPADRHADRRRAYVLGSRARAGERSRGDRHGGDRAPALAGPGSDRSNLDLGVAGRPLERNLVLHQTLSRLVTTLASSLGLLALVLASIGIYGVVSYAVVQRFRELGVCVALGALPRNLLALILRQTMRPVVLGAMLGFAAALMFSESLTAVLFGVDPADPWALGGSALFLAGVALTAALLAGRRATQADPMTTLRHE